MICTHSLADRETSCADGMCPNCLAQDNERLNKAMDNTDWLRLIDTRQAAARIEELEARINAALKEHEAPGACMCRQCVILRGEK